MKNLILLLLLIMSSLPVFSQNKEYAGDKFGYMEYRLTSDDGRLLESGTYWEGKKDGWWYSYHPNGTISAKAYFSNGKRGGTWKFYNDRGVLLAEVTYKNNRRVSAVLHKKFVNS